MYRIWLEEILGIKLRGDKLYVDPVIHSSWESFRVKLKWQSSTYEILVQNPKGATNGVISVVHDGEAVDASGIRLIGDGQIHQVVVTLGEPRPSGKRPAGIPIEQEKVTAR
jgi:cellobiose phosphorylase